MAYNPSNESLFLTDLALPQADFSAGDRTFTAVGGGPLTAGSFLGHQGSICSDDVSDVVDSSSSGNAAQQSAALVPFVCPPPPVKLAVKHRYFSLANSERGTTHGIPDWEKNAILARLRKTEPIDEAAFQKRLSNTRWRNTDQHINRVRQGVKDTEEDVLWEREQAFIQEEKRRDKIFMQRKNLIKLREESRFVQRAQMWYQIVVGHVFLTALIQQRKVQEAMETLSHLMAPMVKRYVALKWKRQAARELTQSQLSNIPFPYPQVIQSMYGTFFQGWPPMLLEKLTSNASPTYLRQGSYLMHEGDIGRVMFMITTGTVSIILHKKGKIKRRAKDNSNGVFQITAPCYVGEFALVCKEPRSASIYCETDIGYWAVRPEDYEDVAKHLSAEVASKQREATDVRRRQNLKKFFPLTVEFMQRFSYFEIFSRESIEKIIECVEPLVLHDGDYLFKSGERDSSVYFIQDGVAVRRGDDGEETNVTTGSCVGMFECSCGVNEQKRTSIISVNYCDVWRLTREALVDVGMTEPVALLHCRKSAKADRALEIRRSPKAPPYLRADPYLSFCLPTAYIQKMYDLATPVVFLNSEKVTIMGQSVGSIVVLLSGIVDVTVANQGGQDTTRIDVAEQQVRLNGDEATRNKAYSPLLLGLVLGSYEFAASMSQYSYTVTSFGLTEALQIEKSKLEAILPNELRSIMHNNTKARDVIAKAFRQRSIDILQKHASSSFAQIYREVREKEREAAARRR